MKVKLFETPIIKGQQIIFSVNTYVIESNKNVIIVDPGGDLKEVLDYIKNYKIVAVLLTHAHADHVLNLKHLKDHAVYLSKDEFELFRNNDYNCANALGLKTENEEINPVLIKEGDFEIANFKIKVIETPGHTKGSVCYQIENHLFTGDTLFYDTIGRTDLYTGSAKMMNFSLKKIVASVSNNVIIYPGHGEFGKISEVKKHNRYLK